MNQIDVAQGGTAKPEIVSLTSLRGIAALAVVLYHFDQFFEGNICIGCYTKIVGEGYLWVDFFFLLSGFILSHVHGDEFSNGSGAYGSFLSKRLGRIYPLHIFTLCVLLLPFFWTSYGPHDLRTPITFAKNVALIHAWGTTTRAPDMVWNYPSWSISAEWMAYLLFPALIIVGRRSKLAMAAMIVFFGIVSLDQLAPYLNKVHDHSFQGMTNSFGWLRCLVEFSAGIVLHRVYLLRPAILQSNVAFGSVFVALVTAMHFGLRDALIVVAMGGLLCSAALNRGVVQRLLSSRPLPFIGKISYSIYMSQIFVSVGVLKKMWSAEFFVGLSPLATIVVYLLACGAVILIASLTYYAIENPCRIMTLWLIGRVRQRQRGYLLDRGH